MIQFRPYQESAIQTARTRIGRGIRRILINAPTGSGKTVIAAGVVQRAVAKGKKVLFLAHRRELIEQTCHKLVEGGVLNFGVIMAGNRLVNASAPVQVASIQTLIRRELPPADVIFVDECHRANSRSYLSILANYPGATVLGLSATPERLDGKGLDDIFDDLIVVETVPNLIAAGFLVRPDCYVGPTADLSGVKTRRGDYDETQLAHAMDKPKLVGDIIANWKRLAPGCKTVVFATSVDHARHIAREFFQAGIPAAVITGETPLAEREATIADWRRGIVQVCVNVYVFVEGFDLPELEVCILARPTQSVSLYLQAVGRVMRPAPGKRRAIILDHAGCIAMHGPPHIHREWTLEGMAKKRAGLDTMRVCDACGMAYEAQPKLWLEETQPELAERCADAASRLLRGRASDRGMDVCPGCGAAKCRVCHDVVRPERSTRDLDGIAVADIAHCPTCRAGYATEPTLVDDETERTAIPDSTDDALIALGETVPIKVTVMNEYKKLINEARRTGRKRGWAYWRLREQYDDALLRECLPRHTGDWWKKPA